MNKLKFYSEESIFKQSQRTFKNVYSIQSHWDHEYLSQKIKIYPKEFDIRILKRYLGDSSVHWTSVTVQDMGATQVPIDGQVDEETVVYAYNGILSAL